MSLSLMILFIGCAYVVLIGALSLLKREELSSQFAVEAVVITLVFSGLVEFAGVSIHPVLFLFLVYLITMRVRLLVDIATIFAQRRQFDLAERFFDLATHLWPDRPGKQTIRVNQGVALLQSGNLDRAIDAFTEIIQSTTHNHTGAKLEAAAHYNLGVAYLRQNKGAQATVEFNIVIDSWPATEYARRANVNLEQYRQKSTPKEN